MQASQRVEFNHALEYALNISNKYKKPLVVFFGLIDNFPDANIRHYFFMLQGLNEVKKNLCKLNIQMIIKHISPDKGVIELSKNACMIIVDRGYLRIQRKWRKNVADSVKCPVIQIESDVVVPIEVASSKEEYAASTIRNKITNKIPEFLTKIKLEEIVFDSFKYKSDSIDIKNISKTVSKLKINDSVKPVSQFIGGNSEAKKILEKFLKEKIKKYAELRNNPNYEFTSDLSPYLHFGHISPVYIALKVRQEKPEYGNDFLEELIVRRELSMNFVYYNKNYDSFKSIPEWAKISLKKHEDDKREFIYSLEEFEKGETHDEYWNSAQKQMINTGKMHGYMRMYWGKKILEWTKKPEDAYNIALFLNNKYELDGRDPNGFTGIAWCFGKHDRAWKERPIFGKIRYMNANGLKRKFDPEEYVRRFNN